MSRTQLIVDAMIAKDWKALADLGCDLDRIRAIMEWKESNVR